MQNDTSISIPIFCEYNWRHTAKGVEEEQRRQGDGWQMVTLDSLNTHACQFAVRVLFKLFMDK